MNFNLEEYIKNKIIKYGPITISEYISIISYKKNHGYYEKHRIGQDFITSPQISKGFGGIIGIWFYQLWLKYFYNKKITLIELGPGNGDLILSLIKLLIQIPEFFNNISIILIENSEYLKNIQKSKLTFLDKFPEKKVNWFNNLGEIEFNSPIFFIANEFFDCLPINQFFYQDNILYEILINFNKEINKFIYCLSKKLSNAQYLINKNYFINNSIIEISSSSINICKYINNLLRDFHGISLIFDYGYTKFSGKSSIQGIYKHKISNIFDKIGETDISSHVNFLDLRSQFINCNNFLYTQKDFLSMLKVNKLRNNEMNQLLNDEEETSFGNLFKILYSKNT
jgi:NADH dehydrogenase [ubiquinone] 1 alpha subcomplex assembly factor 7